MSISRKFMHRGNVFDWNVAELPAEPDAPDFAAPGAASVVIAPVSLSATFLAAVEDVTLTTTVTGENITYIFIEVLLYDEAHGYAYGPVYREYLQAPDHKEVGGIPHPVWGETVAIHTTFRPTLRALSDGAATAFAFAVPEDYVYPPEMMAYSIRGRFITAGDQTSREAKLSFDNTGRMTRIIGFAKHSESRAGTESHGVVKGRGMAQSLGAFPSLGAPRAITPQSGDTFTPEGRVLLPPQDADGAWGEGMGTSTPLTFKEETPFCWESLPLPPATYLAGVLVEDFDGGFTRKYTPLIVLPQRSSARRTISESENRRKIPNARRPQRL